MKQDSEIERKKKAESSAPACERGRAQDLLQPLLHNHSLKAVLPTYLTLTHTRTNTHVILAQKLYYYCNYYCN